MLNGFEKHPDVAKAARVGDPTLVDPEPVTATGVVRQMTNAAMGSGADGKLGVEKINGTVGPNQPTPRSDAPVTTSDTVVINPGAQPPAQSPAQNPPTAAELKPSVADPNELKPNVVSAPDPTALPPLQQSNELESGTSSSSASAAAPKAEEMAEISSSQKKKKKGLKKLNPF
jgi:hypothetical protein